MDVLFPADLKKPGVQDNPKVSKFLLTTFPAEYQMGEPEKEVRGYVVKLLSYLLDKKPWAIVAGKSIPPPTLFSVAQWLVVAYACTKEQRAIHTSYSDLVDSIRTGGELVTNARRTPFLILMFPELVQCAEWSRAKVLDVLLQKKHVAVFTTSVKEMDLVLGDVLMKTIQAYTGTDVVTF